MWGPVDRKGESLFMIGGIEGEGKNVRGVFR